MIYTKFIFKGQKIQGKGQAKKGEEQTRLKIRTNPYSKGRQLHGEVKKERLVMITTNNSMDNKIEEGQDKIHIQREENSMDKVIKEGLEHTKLMITTNKTSFQRADNSMDREWEVEH